MKMKKNLDQLVHLFKLAIDGTGIQEDEHYELQGKPIKAKSWGINANGKIDDRKGCPSTLN